MSSFELDPSNPESSEAMARGDPVDAFLKVGWYGDFRTDRPFSDMLTPDDFPLRGSLEVASAAKSQAGFYLPWYSRY